MVDILPDFQRNWDVGAEKGKEMDASETSYDSTEPLGK